ncbi:MAG: Ig-like domain-containing protein, partial [Tissierellia bacterium]|nr:Ig-like domain-containing protein [Tissierellia bacterium]
RKFIILTIIFAMLFGMTAILPQKAYAKDDVAITVTRNNGQEIVFKKNISRYIEISTTEGIFHWHSDTKTLEVSGANIKNIKVHEFGDDEEVKLAFTNNNSVSEIVSETQILIIKSEQAQRAKLTTDKIEGKSIEFNKINIDAKLIKSLHGVMYFEDVDITGPAALEIDAKKEGLFSSISVTLKNTTFDLKKILIGNRELGNAYLETMKWVTFENSSGSINAPSGDYAIDIGYSVADSVLQFVDCGDIDLHSGDYYKSAIRFGSGKKDSPDIILNKGVSELWSHKDDFIPINSVKLSQPSENDDNYGRFFKCDAEGNITKDVASNIYIRRAGYRVTFDKNGAKENIKPSIVVEKNGLITNPGKMTHSDPTKAFDGWWLFEDDKFVKKWDFETDTVTKDMTLKVKWADLHTVKFDTNGGTPKIDPKYVKDGAAVSKPEGITNGDKQLKYWEKKGSAKAYNFANPVTEDLELIAIWVDKDEPLDKFKVKFETFGGGDPPAQTVNKGDYVEVPSPNPDIGGLKFDHWMYIDEFGELHTFDFGTYAINEDRTLYAYYKPVDKKLMVYINSIENVTPKVTATEIMSGEVLPKPSTPTAPPGKFNHWQDYNYDTYYFKDPVTSNLKLQHWFSDLNEYTDNVVVEINPEGPHTLDIDGTVQLSTDVQPPESHNEVEWRSADATIASVDSNGKVTAHRAGRTEIRALYKYDNDKFDAVEIIVNPKPDSVSVKINETGPITIDNGTKTQLTHTITPDDAPNKNVSWSTNDDWVAIVDENGLVTAISDGEAWIKVKAEDGGNSDAIKIIVNKVGTTSADNYFGYAEATVKQGEDLPVNKLRFTPSLAMEDSPYNIQGIDTNVLGDQEGTVDIKFGDGSVKENVKIYVKVTSDELKEYTVTVTNGTAEKPEYAAGETVTITANVPTGKEFDKWEVKAGGVTLADANAESTTFTMPDEAVTVEATFKDGGGSPPPGTATVTLNPTNLNIKVGQKGLITATVKPDAAPDKTITWTTSDPTIATVNDGIVTAHKIGVATITAKTVDGNTATTTVAVSQDGGQAPGYPQPGYPQPGYPNPYYPYYPNPYYPNPYNPYYPYGYAPEQKIVIEVPETKVTPKETKETPWSDNKGVNTIKLTIGDKAMSKKHGNTTDIIRMDAVPFIKDGRTMVPIRYVAEALGYNVKWNQAKREATLENGKHTVVIPVKTKFIVVDGAWFEADVNPVLKDDRTYLSISNVCKALGMREGEDIIWNGQTKEVTIIIK